MSPLRISRSSDLLQLRNEGYQIIVRAGHLLMEHVPYVTAQKKVAFGTLVSSLELAGDITVPPTDHQAHFIGEVPCGIDGAQLKFIHQIATRDLGGGVVVNVSFSAKKAEGYRDYYDKMATYAALLASPAAALDPSATARTELALASEGDEESVFQYLDNASTRVGIGAVSARLDGHKVAIIGIGGTGSYILDLVAKTPVAEIHLFDGDEFVQHNAFRAPGAASIDELRGRPKKVAHFAGIYSRMHKGVRPHPYYITNDNAHELNGIDFAFLCMDKGGAKKAIVELLERAERSFVDVGMGVELVDDAKLCGIIRVTTSTPSGRDHFRRRVALVDGEANDEYASNIQIADLNCLNAALAVIRWKKHCGFYDDQMGEHSSTYTINCNMLLSEDLARAHS